jgi:hypothetical protein
LGDKKIALTIYPKIIEEPHFESVRLLRALSKCDLFLNFRIAINIECAIAELYEYYLISNILNFIPRLYCWIVRRVRLALGIWKISGETWEKEKGNIHTRLAKAWQNPP